MINFSNISNQNNLSNISIFSSQNNNYNNLTNQNNFTLQIKNNINDNSFSLKKEDKNGIQSSSSSFSITFKEFEVDKKYQHVQKTFPNYIRVYIMNI